MRTRKFMQTLDTGTYRELSIIAKKKGINLQILIRAIIIPYWKDRQIGLMPALPPKRHGK